MREVAQQETETDGERGRCGRASKSTISQVVE